MFSPTCSCSDSGSSGSANLSAQTRRRHVVMLGTACTHLNYIWTRQIAPYSGSHGKIHAYSIIVQFSTFLKCFTPDRKSSGAMSHLTFHLGAADACIRLIIVSPSHDYHLLARPCQEDEKEAYRMLLTDQMFEDCMGLGQRDMLESRVSYFSANIDIYSI